MQGSLWRQRVGSDTARQLTDGPGYDHQPDWSPDGRWVVYSSYQKDALAASPARPETGADRALLDDGNVHLDARWSPDGSRIAFVSTMHEGRWHVFVAPLKDGTFGTPQRITEDTNSGLPRYYYGVWDHYLSPTWSPDGRELILVSNRGRVMGSGGFWRMAARAGAPMRELWYEETTWKARPDWARDGKRVVYSGYHGRQWNQLWLMTSEGGDPFQLTYGEYDITNPRWSRDGRRDRVHLERGRQDGRTVRRIGVPGGTSLWVLEIPGGRRSEITRGFASGSDLVSALGLDRRFGRARDLGAGLRVRLHREELGARQTRGGTRTRPSCGASGNSSTATSTAMAGPPSRCRRGATRSRPGRDRNGRWAARRSRWRTGRRREPRSA